MKKRLVLILSILLIVVLYMNLICSNSSGKGYTKEQLSRLAVIVHRAGKGVMENSIQGIRGCIDNGYSCIEIDVRMTADGELVLCHDESIERVTNGKGRVCDMTLAEIRRYCIENAPGIPLPTLGDALETVNGKCHLLIDVKRDANAEKLAKTIINEVALYQAFDWVSVQSFNDDVLGELHRLGHPFPLEKIFLLKIPGLPIIIDEGVSLFNFDKYDYISSFNISHKDLTQSLVDEIHRRGKSVKMWSPDTPQKTRRLTVDGVITGSPELWK